MKNLLFIIDMQNDFCNPGGNLYVPGAEEDIQRLYGFIATHTHTIDSIILTQDNHQVMDIAHPGFWKNSAGKHPDPYTTITLDDIRSGKWEPVMYHEESLEYIRKLEELKEFPHTIWPEHCIWGSEGAAIHPILMEIVKEWCRQGKMIEIISKGTHPLTEHYGAFQANIPIREVPEIHFNLPLLERMKTFDRIYIAGEAKSHCVANTIKQLLDYPEIISGLVILENCMSDVPGFETVALDIYKEAYKLGAKVISVDAY